MNEEIEKNEMRKYFLDHSLSSWAMEALQSLAVEMRKS